MPVACESCDAVHSEDAEECRECGHDQFRPALASEVRASDLETDPAADAGDATEDRTSGADEPTRKGAAGGEDELTDTDDERTTHDEPADTSDGVGQREESGNRNGGTATDDGSDRDAEGGDISGGASHAWFHTLFALAFGLSVGFATPGISSTAVRAGVVFVAVIFSWIVVVVLTFVTRRVTGHEPLPADSINAYALASIMGVQMVAGGLLFGGTGSLVLIGGVTFAALNVVLAPAIAVDMYLLREDGVEWSLADYALPVAVLALGYLAGAVYWYRRGRARVAAAQN